MIKRKLKYNRDGSCATEFPKGAEVLAWKDADDAALAAFDRLLVRHSLVLVRYKTKDDAIIIAVESVV